ncbi:hypothetical protein KC19_1G320600 [Ceratodon purpureus]|uniref:Uncharacterized protein n=1 Tax=Ceratodon purpureus TaxID=3225 RepID=A0A8T0JDZ9_CERPU|nr:hypothetical protein KC19_1G320600 [Ceratodon purpureus]
MNINLTRKVNPKSNQFLQLQNPILMPCLRVPCLRWSPNNDHLINWKSTTNHQSSTAELGDPLANGAKGPKPSACEWVRFM